RSATPTSANKQRFSTPTQPCGGFLNSQILPRKIQGVVSFKSVLQGPLGNLSDEGWLYVINGGKFVQLFQRSIEVNPLLHQAAQHVIDDLIRRSHLRLITSWQYSQAVFRRGFDHLLGHS